MRLPCWNCTGGAFAVFGCCGTLKRCGFTGFPAATPAFPGLLAAAPATSGLVPGSAGLVVPGSGLPAPVALAPSPVLAVSSGLTVCFPFATSGLSACAACCFGSFGSLGFVTSVGLFRSGGSTRLPLACALPTSADLPGRSTGLPAGAGFPDGLAGWACAVGAAFFFSFTGFVSWALALTNASAELQIKTSSILISFSLLTHH